MRQRSQKRVLPAILLGALALALTPGCERTPPGGKITSLPKYVGKKPHSAALRMEKKSNGRYKAIPSDDPIHVGPYDPASTTSQHVVYWIYTNKATVIQFKDPTLPAPKCYDDSGVCIWPVPAGLLKEGEDKKKYGYEVSGQYDDAIDIDPKDPEVEIDK